jgi:uncharacterized membrane protein
VPGLDRVDSVEAITAMRGIISEAASNPLFLLLLIGWAVVAVVVGTIAVTRLRQPGSGHLLAAALFTLVPGIVTVAFNVPLNKKLNALNRLGSRPPMPRESGRHTSARGWCGTMSGAPRRWLARCSTPSG